MQGVNNVLVHDMLGDYFLDNAMNERIKELVGKAKFMAEETINRQISKNAELDAFAEKFAELIVRECMKVADNRYQTMFPSEVIAKHFGVE